MRSALLIACWLLFTCGEAGAQSCRTGCGCQGKHGSGWRRMDTESQKCLPCSEVDRYCGTDKVNCRWEGCRNLELIRESCPKHIPAVTCPMK